jgi:hypothetical protein
VEYYQSGEYGECWKEVGIVDLERSLFSFSIMLTKMNLIGRLDHEILFSNLHMLSYQMYHSDQPDPYHDEIDNQ